MLWLLSEYVKMRRGFLLDASALPLVPEKSYFSLLPVEIRSLAGFMYMRNELRRFEEMLCESSFEWDVVALSFDSSHFEKKAATHAECICWICRYKKEHKRTAFARLNLPRVIARQRLGLGPPKKPYTRKELESAWAYYTMGIVP